jgi:DNA-binding MarR family transcriptional regulator
LVGAAVARKVDPVSDAALPGTASPQLPESAALRSIIALFSAWSASSFQREFTAGDAIPSDPNAVPLIVELATRGAQRPSAIADKLHVSAPTASRLAQKLVEAGLVARIADPSDARATLVTLTATGIETVRGMFAAGDWMMASVLSDWTPAEQDTLTRVLGRLADDVVAHAATAVSTSRYHQA